MSKKPIDLSSPDMRLLQVVYDLGPAAVAELLGKIAHRGHVHPEVALSLTRSFVSWKLQNRREPRHVG